MEMDLDNGKWTIDSEGVESGGVEMHLFSLWCVPSENAIELPEITGIGFRIHQVSGWLFRPLKQAILKDTGWGNLEET
ncbi:conserved hypothetical protein, partial [Ricinus communis]